jgi:hypothetical protein
MLTASCEWSALISLKCAGIFGSTRQTTSSQGKSLISFSDWARLRPISFEAMSSIHLPDLTQAAFLAPGCTFSPAASAGKLLRSVPSTGDCHMRYFRITDEGRWSAAWGGDPTYWLEVNDRGDAERELQVYPNGNVLRYDRAHDKDENGVLDVMVLDGDEGWWARYEITMEVFEEQWRARSPLNRGPEPPYGLADLNKNNANLPGVG